MRNILKGDVVRLKSGGPLMTVGNLKDQRAVLGFSASTFAFCQWFENEQLMERWFDSAALQPADHDTQETPRL
ncbi:YodC family protein [Pseudomonas sp. CCOS 191]|uniref:YodC family protein n=1 Tax=Pseudomonas sp. CCOS 191 TaxID=1649877 RepID=UPI00062B49A8|nr:DUF2158 domain-containing protein [Pseudomonas sp. CCOS 191]